MFVKVSETYDLSTKVGKMGMLGIHTPDGRLVYNMWKGFYQNYRKMRFVSCDVALACASMLPADPLQVGVEAGDIAPQDMFNPILYKAVSNDSMTLLLNRIYAGAHREGNTDWVGKNSVTDDNDTTFVYDSTREVDQFAIYYGLLSDTSGWKKAMPQAGLSMSRLRPITWSLLASQGQPGVCGGLSNLVAFPSDGSTAGSSGNVVTSKTRELGRFLRGPACVMPAIDTMVMTSDGSCVNFSSVQTNLPSTHADLPEVNVTDLQLCPDSASTVVLPNIDVPDCFVAAIILPPAKLSRLYYRLKVTWTVEFFGPRPLTDLTNWYGLALQGTQSYGSDYLDQAALITSGSNSGKQAMVDAGDSDIQKVMEGC